MTFTFYSINFIENSYAKWILRGKWNGPHFSLMKFGSGLWRLVICASKLANVYSYNHYFDPGNIGGFTICFCGITTNCVSIAMKPITRYIGLKYAFVMACAIGIASCLLMNPGSNRKKIMLLIFNCLNCRELITFCNKIL